MTYIINPFGFGPATDPHWANTILLCGCEGTDLADANLDDESFANHSNGTSNGSAEYRTAAGLFVFGTAGVYFFINAVGHVTFADHADWTLGSGSFTLEFFIAWHNATFESGQVIMSHWNSTGNQRGWALKYAGDEATNRLHFFGSADGSATTSLLSHNFTPTQAQIYYICVERSGNDFRMYLGTPGGTASMVASATNAISFFNSTAPLQISGLSGTSERLNNVSMDEIRLTTAARYATDSGYSVPSAAFPRI